MNDIILTIPRRMDDLGRMVVPFKIRARAAQKSSVRSTMWTFQRVTISTIAVFDRGRSNVGVDYPAKKIKF